MPLSVWQMVAGLHRHFDSLKGRFFAFLFVRSLRFLLLIVFPFVCFVYFVVKTCPKPSGLAVQPAFLFPGNITDCLFYDSIAP
jgi:hypothetical protein